MIGESMYQELILEHYKHPQGRGLREPYDAEVHHVNPTCGDEITLRVKLGDAGKIVDVSYDGQGCSISQAAASVLHELATGSTVEETLSVVDEFTRLMQGRGQVEADEEVLGDAVAFAGVAKFPARVKCALLSWMAYKDAVVRSAQ
ncbi:SUF system NifU family Fe-S cluster assembly protein [Nonomuraea antimicrobica]|uniref:SUF system NifU family Fe-S cluster assembly protein n=1 Tax=Nonomuraea antimicrobica TaxID=561173 RepID=A0ABP7B6G8_9ACTN